MPYFLLVLLFCGGTAAAQSEADYVSAIARHWNDARTEVPVTSGRVDILTATYAVEVDWANKWKQSIGQALWYGLQTNRAAGIILLLRSEADYKYYLQLNSALDHGGLTGKIKVWLYPRDFAGVSVTAPRARALDPPEGEGQYWLSVNSNKRHRSSCQWFRRSKGRLCTASEGTAARCCH